MIGKNGRYEDDNTSDDNVCLHSEKKKSLQGTSSKAMDEVRLCFEQLAKVLRTREKQLIRQIEAIHNQQLSIVQSNQDSCRRVPSIRINLDDRRELEENILKFGELSSSERNSIDVRDAEPYKIEDYEEAHRDHVTLDKFIGDKDKKEEDEEEEEEVARTSGRREKYESPVSSCDSSINTSSDAASDHEITVLVNRNYSESSDGLAEPVSRRGCADLQDSSSRRFDVEAEPKLRTPSKSTSMDVIARKKCQQDADKHPKQIQQWLEQILVETETEPTIHEIEHFAEISKSRFKELQFPLET